MAFSVGAETFLQIQIHPAIIAYPAIIALPLASIGISGYFGLIPFPRNSLMLNFGSIANMAFPEIDGREAMGGYTSIAYLGFIADIETFPGEPDITTVTDVGDVVKLIGAYIMKQGKFFFEVKVPPFTSKHSPVSQGEVGGKSFKNTGEIYVPGIDAQSMGLARMLNNRYAILILTDPDGKTRVALGSKNLPLYFIPKGDSGAKGVDKKGFTFTYESESFAPGWVYDGPIPLSGSVIEGIS
jgi:hypothetical protein